MCRSECKRSGGWWSAMGIGAHLSRVLKRGYTQPGATHIKCQWDLPIRVETNAFGVLEFNRQSILDWMDGSDWMYACWCCCCCSCCRSERPYLFLKVLYNEDRDLDWYKSWTTGCIGHPSRPLDDEHTNYGCIRCDDCATRILFFIPFSFLFSSRGDDTNLCNGHFGVLPLVTFSMVAQILVLV